MGSEERCIGGWGGGSRGITRGAGYWAFAAAGSTCEVQKAQRVAAMGMLLRQ